jgi:hypothetical protein
LNIIKDLNVNPRESSPISPYLKTHSMRELKETKKTYPIVSIETAENQKLSP